MTVIFEDPMPLNATERWPERLAPLTERPGEWARVYISPHIKAARAYASKLRMRPQEHALPEGQFEFRAAPLPDGTAAVYARYLGPPAEDDEQ